MLVRFWGTRGSIPVALTGAGVRSKIKQALLQANGRRFDDDAAIERFMDEELAFPIRHRYGGSSACVDIVGGTEYMVCDMGSGLRSLGQQIMREHGPGTPQVYNFFMSHVHWDHLMGFPFFPPAYIPGNTIRIHGCHPLAVLQEAFHRQQSDPCFPVAWEPTMAIRMGIVSKRTARSLSIRRMANISWNRRRPPRPWSTSIGMPTSSSLMPCIPSPT